MENGFESLVGPNPDEGGGQGRFSKVPTADLREEILNQKVMAQLERFAGIIDRDRMALISEMSMELALRFKQPD